ncbi:hypothetical protein [Methylobacterium durans]|uniref:Uncharacterized protein n=1 Tax=Methylobacterium durans TaxID=2202825 RepID=A0A2U8W1Y0_9HYPH|nr:hypothetical protein [Methylobacterium durans]AWN40077.1 hypothetical protein DK389_05380 [Methylobacterium durans]
MTRAKQTPPAPTENLTELRAQVLRQPIRALHTAAIWGAGRDNAVEAIAAVRRDYPDLHPAGIGHDPSYGWNWEPHQLERERDGMTGRGLVAAFERAARFLSYASPFAQTAINRERTSHSWMSAAERITGGNVPNGMFLAAAYALGFRVRQAPGTPYAFINLGERAVKLDTQRTSHRAKRTLS